MDLNARVNVNCAWVDVNFSNGHCVLILLPIFIISIPINITVLLILHTKFQTNIPSQFGEMDLNSRVAIIFLWSHKFLNGHCDLIPLHIFFHFDANYLYFKQNFSQIYIVILDKMTIFISFVILSNGGHLEFSTRLNVTIPWSLMKFKIHGCSGLREKVI